MVDKGFFIDYLTFTIKIETDRPTVAASYLHKYVDLEIEDCELKGGFNGYKQSLHYPSGVKVLFDGGSSRDAMGIHIILPGSALNDNDHINFNIFKLIDKLKIDKLDYNISRIDIAKDTDEIPFSYFYNKYLKHEYACRYEKKNCRQNVDANNEGTLYFGKRGSLTMFRIYNKAYQLDEEGIWTRVELEVRNEACEEIIESMRNGNVNCYFEGHLRFVNKRVKPMTRSVTTDIYKKFLDNPTKRIRVSKKNNDDTLEWARKQCAPTFKALIRDYGIDFVLDMILSSKISKKQVKKRFGLKVVKSKNEVFNQSGDIKDIGYVVLNESGEIDHGKQSYNPITCKFEYKDINKLREKLKDYNKFVDVNKEVNWEEIELEERNIMRIKLLNLAGDSVDIDIDSEVKIQNDGRKMIKAEWIQAEIEELFGDKKAI